MRVMVVCTVWSTDNAAQRSGWTTTGNETTTTTTLWAELQLYLLVAGQIQKSLFFSFVKNICLL